MIVSFVFTSNCSIPLHVVFTVRVGLVRHRDHELLLRNNYLLFQQNDFDSVEFLDVQIQAHYQTEWGEHKKSLLLTAGWYSSPSFTQED
jgi:hypothetical protein